MNVLLNQLNEAQRQATLQTDGPIMVIAGAGSGKTRVLTFKVAYLISLGVDPFRILALTFTNKAAREMKERIVQLVGPEARNVWMGTFHSIFARLLRIEGHRLGYPSNFTIYDTDDSKNLIKTIVREQNLDPKVYQPSFVLARISSCKANLINAPQYLENSELMIQDKIAARPETGRLFALYQQRCFKASAMDFDDLLLNTYVILRDFPDALVKYQRKFEYILVDEYQDTNHVQYQIVKQLAANNENICVVGDDAQSIYGFRGANIQNILNFKYDYPDHRIFKLEQNYRSTQTIVNAANSIIVNNKDQIRKEVWTDNEAGQKIRVMRAQSENEEGNLVAASIFQNKMNFQLSNNAFAVLYRTNAQSRAMEEALRKLNIPYRIYGGLSFYKRKEIKDLLAYFRLAINHNDEEAFVRIINYPARGIGKTTLEKLTVAAADENKSLWEVAEDTGILHTLFNFGTQQKISEFVIMIRSFSLMIGSKGAYEAGRHIAVSSGILRDLDEDKTPEGVSRLENVQELLNAMREFSEKPPENKLDDLDERLAFRTLTEFMQDIALLTDSDTEVEDGNTVSLMTVHQAKGLEFPYVYVVGLEENLFPSFQSLATRNDLEEERRLFYVAVTRAQQRVFLSYAENRYRWGDLVFCEPSRFIEEIDSQYLDTQGLRRPRPRSLGSGSFIPEDTLGIPVSLPTSKKHFKPLSESVHKPAPQHTDSHMAPELQTGMEVEHERFGRGKVISLEGSGPNCKATVFFNNVGQKQLLVKFARLRIIG